MAEVAVRVGGRSYVVGCGDGEEARVLALAGRIDAEAGSLGAAPTIPEARLLLMTALMLADKLDEAEATLAARPAPDAEKAAEAVDTAAARIEALAAAGGAEETAPFARAPGLSRAERRALRGARPDDEAGESEG